MSVVRSILLTLGVLCSAAAFGAGGAATLLLRTEGPDRYADGVAAAAGELYAVTWGMNEGDCAFLADGTFVSTNGSRLVGYVRTSFDGCCAREYRWATGRKMPFALEFTAGEMQGFAGGRFELHLLDTRTTGGVPSVREDAEGRLVPARIVSSACVAGATLADIRKGDDVFRLRENPVAAAAALPADAPDPVIAGCRPVTVDGVNYLELTLKRTVHYIDYDFAKGSTPAMADETGDAAKAPVSGSAADDPNEPVKVLVPADGSSGFFRAIRHGQRVRGGKQEGGKAQ